MYLLFWWNMAADELNKQGFNFAVITIEGGYSAWKDAKKKKDESGNIK